MNVKYLDEHSRTGKRQRAIGQDCLRNPVPNISGKLRNFLMN